MSKIVDWIGTTMIIAALTFLGYVIAYGLIDFSEINYQSINADVADKWHEKSCSPIYGAQGEYFGEDCTDEYTVVLLSNGKRLEAEVRGKSFKSLKIGDKVTYNFGVGRLGGIHNTSVKPLTQDN